MCKNQEQAYNSGCDLDAVNPYTPFTEHYYAFEKGRLDAAGLDLLD